MREFGQNVEALAAIDQPAETETHPLVYDQLMGRTASIAIAYVCLGSCVPNEPIHYGQKNYDTTGTVEEIRAKTVTAFEAEGLRVAADEEAGVVVATEWSCIAHGNPCRRWVRVEVIIEDGRIWVDVPCKEPMGSSWMDCTLLDGVPPSLAEKADHVTTRVIGRSLNSYEIKSRGGGPNCTKGCRCGNACISCAKTCRIGR